MNMPCTDNIGGEGARLFAINSHVVRKRHAALHMNKACNTHSFIFDQILLETKIIMYDYNIKN